MAHSYDLSFHMQSLVESVWNINTSHAASSPGAFH